MGTWTVERAYMEDSKFNLGLAEPSLGARNCSKDFMCITSSNLHNRPSKMGFKARRSDSNVNTLSPLPYLAPLIWYL